MDRESADSRSKGAWDPQTQLGDFYKKWCTPEPTPDFLIDDTWCGAVGSLGFGTAVSPETIQFWMRTLKGIYVGDEGRRKVKGALLNLMERDSLLLRLRDIKCPVYWLQVRKKTAPSVLAVLTFCVTLDFAPFLPRPTC